MGFVLLVFVSRDGGIGAGDAVDGGGDGTTVMTVLVFHGTRHPGKCCVCCRPAAAAAAAVAEAGAVAVAV